MTRSTANPAQPKFTPVKLAVAVALGVLLAGAIYLIAVRGPALLLDLSALAGMLCL